jgi:hypothetical protein
MPPPGTVTYAGNSRKVRCACVKVIRACAQRVCDVAAPPCACMNCRQTEPSRTETANNVAWCSRQGRPNHHPRDQTSSRSLRHSRPVNNHQPPSPVTYAARKISLNERAPESARNRGAERAQSARPAARLNAGSAPDVEQRDARVRPQTPAAARVTPIEPT